MKPKALDLFCGAGGASMGLYRAGYDVTGVDITPMKRYPFTFIQADALEYPLSGFDLIWASPPCQRYSVACSLPNCDRESYPDLIAAVRARLQRTNATWIIENVQGAPLNSSIMLCGTMFNLKVFRHRYFESNRLFIGPPHVSHKFFGTCNSHRLQKNNPGEYVTVAGNGGWKGSAKRWREAMGIDWMTRDELVEAVPPAYAEFLAKQAIMDGRG